MNHEIVASMEKNINKKYVFYDTKPAAQVLNKSKNKHFKHSKIISD